MNILVVDHECHRKTKSADFFLDLLRTEHSIDVHYYKKHYSCKIPEEKVDWSDIVVFWEFLPSRFRLGIAGKPCVFVPMYDNEWSSYWQWKRLAWSGMGVVSFCDKVTAHARRCGVQNIIDVRYFRRQKIFRKTPEILSVFFCGKEVKLVFLLLKGFFLQRMDMCMMLKELMSF